MTNPTARPNDDYIDRLNAEVERRLAYLQFAERAASPVLISDAWSMLNNTLARLRDVTEGRGR
jgi:hypothetical protein